MLSQILGKEIVLRRPVAKVLELELHQHSSDVNRLEATWLLVTGRQAVASRDRGRYDHKSLTDTTRLHCVRIRQRKR
jgi:hypothetical protein